jgi:DNA-binding NarL/FixJ family response regulator
MPLRRVLIVSHYGLFREGLKRILAASKDLEVVGHEQSLPEAEKRVREGGVDVVIVDQAIDVDNHSARSETLSRLLAIPDVQVITVSLETGDMWVYRQERLVQASDDDLVAALEGNVARSGQDE